MTGFALEDDLCPDERAIIKKGVLEIENYSFEDDYDDLRQAAFDHYWDGETDEEEFKDECWALRFPDYKFYQEAWEKFPVHMATEERDFDLLTSLIADGKNVDDINADGETSLHQACALENVDMCEFLITHGADVQRKDQGAGWTPLHHAARYGNKEVCEVLLSKHADVNAVERYGWTPLHFSMNNERHSSSVAKVLLAHGADVSAKTTDGRAPLDLACDAETKEVLMVEIAKRDAAELHSSIHSHLTSAKPFVQEPKIAQTMRDDIAGPVNTDVHHEDPHRQTRKM